MTWNFTGHFPVDRLYLKQDFYHDIHSDICSNDAALQHHKLKDNKKILL
jgi:hypothetical protein